MTVTNGMEKDIEKRKERDLVKKKDYARNGQEKGRMKREERKKMRKCGR